MNPSRGDARGKKEKKMFGDLFPADASAPPGPTRGRPPMGTPLHQKLMVNLPHPSQRSQVGDSKQQPQALTVRTTTTTPRHIHPPKINQGGRSRQTLGPASDDTPLQQGVKLIPRPGTFSKVWTTVGKPNHKHNIIVLRSGGTQHNTIANHKLHQ